MTDEPVRVSREALVAVAKAAYAKGREDAMGEVVPGETRVSADIYSEEPADVEALLDRAFAPLRAELEGVVVNVNEQSR